MRTETFIRNVDILKCFYCKGLVQESQIETSCPKCGRVPSTSNGRIIVVKIKAKEMQVTTVKKRFFGLFKKTTTSIRYVADNSKNQGWVDRNVNNPGIKIE